VLLAAVLAPIVQNWRDEPEDSFPLSFYPMFTEARNEIARPNYLVGYDLEGNRQLLPYVYVGQGGMNQVRRQVNSLVNKGDAARLCRTINANLVRRNDPAYADLVRVDIVTGSYRFDDYFTGNKQPQSERVNASCPVTRR
jgi:hypothetical protein